MSTFLEDLNKITSPIINKGKSYLADLNKVTVKSVPSPYIAPIKRVPDNSTAGIVLNTISGLPKATADTLTGLGQGILRGVGSLGTTAGNIPTQIANATVLHNNPQPLPFQESIDTSGSKLTSTLFGGKPIDTLQKTYSDTHQAAQEAGAGKYGSIALAGAITGGEFAGDILNFDMFGGGKQSIENFAKGDVPEAFIKFLTKNDAPTIESTLNKIGLDSVNSKILAEKLGPAKTTEQVKNILIEHGTSTPKLTGEVGPIHEVSKNPIPDETPIQALARSEAYAASKHLTPEQQAAENFKKTWQDTYGNRPATIESPTQLQQRKIQTSDEGIPLARKSVPFMPKTTQVVDQRPSQSPSLVDTTTGEGRSLEKTASQLLEESSQHTIPSKDVSLVDTISKEPTPVKDKVNIIDYVRTPDRVLAKIGLEEEGKFLRSQHEQYLKELPKNIDKVTEWSKRASKGGNEDIFRYLDGEAIDLKPQDKQIATEIKTWLKQWADRLGLPEDNRISYYITHIFDQELLKKEFPEELAKMIDNKLPGEVYDPFLEKRLGTLGYKRDTWAALDAYVKRATRKVHMDPALEKIKDASGKLEKSQYDYVKSYIANINMRPGKIDNLIDNGIKQVIGYRLGQRPLLAVTKLLRQMTYRAFLGLNPASALKNISQGINTYSQLGEKYTTIGYANLFKKGAKAELEAEGVLNGGFIEDRALSSTKKAIEKFDKTLFYFFEKAEHINRGAAYFGAKAQGIAKGMNEAEAIDYAKSVVRKTQFVFGKIDTPLILSSDLGKTVFQFMSYTAKQTEFLLEMSKKAISGDEKAKNFVGLLRYAIAGTIFVATIGKAFGMKISDLVPAYRFGTPPSLKVPAALGSAALDLPDKYGNERSLGQKAKDIGSAALSLIPASTQAKKTYQGYQALKEGKSTDSAGRAQYDVGGTPLKNAQALIFGKYSGEGAKDYYENDMTYAEATLENLKKSPNGKAELAKIITENPTLAKGILEVIKKQSLGITKDDEKLLHMGVATKQRAKEVAKQINSLDNKEAKKALITEYIKKKIITDAVAKQLVEFLKK